MVLWLLPASKAVHRLVLRWILPKLYISNLSSRLDTHKPDSVYAIISLGLQLYHHDPAYGGTQRGNIHCGEIRQLQRGGLPPNKFVAEATLLWVPIGLVVSHGATRIVTVALTVPHLLHGSTLWLRS